MGSILICRLLYAVAVMLTVATLVFAIMHLTGDPLAGLVPPGSSPEQEAALRHRFGLDQPLVEQYVRFVAGTIQGDFGESWTQRRPAGEIVFERLPATLRLAGAAILLALVAGLALGLAAGVRPGGLADLLATGIALLGQALPGFWLGTMLILLFAVRLKWLPSSGATGPESLILPALTLAAYPTALIARLLRASLIETLRKDYIRTARGKGLTPWQVVARHALKNAALPTLGFVGVQIGFLLGGAVVVESVFGYPGAGRLALQAVADRDLPVVQTFVVVLAALVVLINLTVDLLARWLDPRIRHAAGATAQARRA